LPVPPPCPILSGVQSPARRCFVHIGLAKTGTSYLQSVFWSARETLAAQGLTLLLNQRDHFHLALALRGRLAEGDIAPKAFTVLDRFSAAAATVSPDSDALITQERLAAAKIAQVHQLLDLLPGWEVHVIITARDLGRQLPSVWQETVRKFGALGYDEYVQAVVDRSPLAGNFWSRQGIIDVAARWARGVSAERTHIVTVPPSGSAQGLLLERFCSVVGVDPTLLDTTAAVSNVSLGYSQTELLRRVKISLGESLGDPDAAAVKWGTTYLAKDVLAPQGGHPPEFPRRLQDWCRQTSEEAIAELRSRGYHIIGDLAELMPHFPPPSQPEPVIGDAEVAATAARALATVVAEGYADMEQRRRLRARLLKEAKRLSTRDRGAGQSRAEE